MRPDAPDAGTACIACQYIGFVTLIVVAFFAGAWTEATILQPMPTIVSNQVQTDMHMPELIQSPTPTDSMSQTGPAVESAMPVSVPTTASVSTVQPPPPPTSMKQLPQDCPLGYSRNTGNCIFLGCPIGYEIQNGFCVKLVKQCTPAEICGGVDRDGDGVGDDVFSRSMACNESKTDTSCEYGCKAGACRPPPRGAGSITVTPSTVHAGDTVQVAWSAKNMRPGSCKVSEMSQMINDSGNGEEGTFVSSPIKERTPYVLSCFEFSGAVYTAGAMVELVQ